MPGTAIGVSMSYSEVFMKIRSLVFIISAVLLAMCASSPSTKTNLTNYAPDNEINYDKYLVDVASYTSSGKIYHTKYIKVLKGFSKYAVVDHKLELSEKSVGFYFDKKLSDREDLYFGFDFYPDSAIASSVNSYEDNARLMIQRYYENILSFYGLLEDVMSEKAVKGIVIGMKWKSGGRNESMTLWVRKQDAADFANKMLTFKNLVYKTTVTNSEGKIVRIAL